MRRSRERKQRRSGPDVDEAFIANGARPCEPVIVMVTDLVRSLRTVTVPDNMSN